MIVFKIDNRYPSTCMQKENFKWIDSFCVQTFSSDHKILQLKNCNFFPIH